MNATLLAFAALDARLATHCRLLSLQRYEQRARIGVHHFERAAPQRMWFDVDLCVRLDQAAAAHDELADTLDYDFIRTTIAALVGTHHHELQETLCDAILQAMLRRDAVQAARVATRKPDVYPDSAAVGTERIGVKPWPAPNRDAHGR